MNTHHCIAHGLQAISALDLSQIKRKIMEPCPEGKGWTEQTADEAEKWYRRFLEVCLRFPQFPAVPNRLIDDFWHQHILDTQAYAADCQEIFGEFMHHYPYFGLNGDASERDSAFEQTDNIYKDLFGESCIATFEDKPNNCMSPNCVGAGCNHKGSGTGCGQRRSLRALGAGCGHKGSGTGCGQGGRGGRSPITPIKIPNMELNTRCASNYTKPPVFIDKIGSYVEERGAGCHPKN